MVELSISAKPGKTDEKIKIPIKKIIIVFFIYFKTHSLRVGQTISKLKNFPLGSKKVKLIEGRISFLARRVHNASWTWFTAAAQRLILTGLS
jgi:hypothetical protein